MHSIILYTKKNCPLCEDGKAALEMVTEELGLTFEELDIYQDDALLEQYHLMIPVITLDGRMIAAGEIKLEALQQIFTRFGA